MDNYSKNLDNTTGQTDVRGGDILLSSPLLTDPNFNRSVVLVLQEDNDLGHIGLVLNHSLDLTLEEICSITDRHGSMRVFNGGPVDMQRIFWLHTLGERLPGALEVLPGLYIGGDYDTLIRTIADDVSLSGQIRFYLGYSGWSAGQLSKEIDLKAWAVLRNLVSPGMLLESDGEEMWHSFVRLLGPDYRHWLILPSDPSLN